MMALKEYAITELCLVQQDMEEGETKRTAFDRDGNLQRLETLCDILHDIYRSESED